jgi:hypothetical protein
LRVKGLLTKKIKITLDKYWCKGTCIQGRRRVFKEWSDEQRKLYGSLNNNNNNNNNNEKVKQISLKELTKTSGHA